MNDPVPRKPGDLILDRYLPDADEETRERAREVLRAYALGLVRLAERLADVQPPDSPNPVGRPRIPLAPDAPSP